MPSIPGLSRAPAFGTSTRIVAVRVSSRTTGEMNATRPRRGTPGSASSSTWATLPTRAARRSCSKTSPSTQTRSSAAIVNAGAPAITCCPTTTSFAITTPARGARNSRVRLVARVAMMRSISDGGTSQYSRRRRADRRRSAAVPVESPRAASAAARRTARTSSSCAATSIGEYSAKSGAPASTVTPVVFTKSSSTQPSTLGAIVERRVSSTTTRAAMRSDRTRGARSTVAKVTPMRRAAALSTVNIVAPSVATAAVLMAWSPAGWGPTSRVKNQVAPTVSAKRATAPPTRMPRERDAP